MIQDGGESLVRVHGESKPAHAAFLDYIELGPRRSIRDLHARYVQRASSESPADLRPPTTSLNTLFNWSQRNRWQARLEAWTAELDRRDQERWAARRRDVRESDWQAGEALRTLADQILVQTPNFLKTTKRLVKGRVSVDPETGKAVREPDREVITVGINVGELTRALELGSKLQRLAAEMTQQQIDITSGGKILGLPALLALLSERGLDANEVIQALIQELSQDADGD